jgi:outer membrane protein assembly factor BamD
MLDLRVNGVAPGGCTPRRPRPGLARGRSWALRCVLACAAAAGAVGCKNGPSRSLQYGQTAIENYEMAQSEFRDRDWEDAIRYADFVRIRFPVSKYAVESELLIARSQFELREYLSAKDSFKQFEKLHPTHRHVRNGWVAYMGAVAAFMAAPETAGVFLPPDEQLDQAMLEDALVELRWFFDHHPNSPMVGYAKKLREKVLRRLLDHELYVARFYLDRGEPDAAIGRLESAHSRYAGIGMDAEVLFLLGLTYLRMREVELSRSTFTELQTQHPQHYRGAQAQVYLKWIREQHGPADPNRTRPDRGLKAPKSPPRLRDDIEPGTMRRKRKPAPPASASPTAKAVPPAPHPEPAAHG